MIHIKRLDETLAPSIGRKHDLDAILSRLEDEKRNYDLGGVELTPEDAEAVVRYMEEDRLSEEEAIEKVLIGISDCLE